MTTNSTTHYDTLQVPPTASFAQIKLSFHRLARLRHPDKAAHSNLHGDTENNSTYYCKTVPSFIEIQTAWEVLRDPVRRSKYDDTLHVKKYFQSLDQHNIVRLSDMTCEVCVIESDSSCNEQDESVAGEECSAEDYVYSYECACGDVFEIIRSDLIESSAHSDQLYTSACGSCSCRICVVDDIGVN